VADEPVAATRRSSLTPADQMHWLLRRLHSLAGIVPIGGFLFFHIFENSYVLRGADVWWKESEFTRTLPIQIPVEAALLWIPILYHAIYGLVITATAQPNNYSYGRNYQYTLQRITGVIALGFILYHVLSTRAWFYMTGVETNYARMHEFMMNPLILTIYVVGVVSCLYHLTNGIFTFCITWGITDGPRAQMMVNYACVALFVILSIVSVDILVAFRTPA
jgi:succinate dehydrogenase / fumarate reductase, cytochrome b subunit